MKLDLVESQLQKAQPKIDKEDERYGLPDTCYLISQHEM